MWDLGFGGFTQADHRNHRDDVTFRGFSERQRTDKAALAPQWLCTLSAVCVISSLRK